MKVMTQSGYMKLVIAPALGIWMMSVPSAHASSDAKALDAVNKMIRAHGGIDAWRSAPTVCFQDSFVPAGTPAGVASQVTVEQTQRRAYLDYPAFDASAAWDGTKCWSTNWALPTPPRFLALLNYYFANLPWLTMDPGVNLAYEGRQTLFDDPTEYITVRMTFDPSVGDTPEDYYVLYVHPETYTLKATVYVVTYKSVLPPGMDRTPEHVLVYDSWTTVDGLKVPTQYTIFDERRSVYATCSLIKWSFREPFDTSRMTMPENAVIDESQP
jgi:hypothetical protein